MMIDDETLMAYVDGELHDLERAKVERLVRRDASVNQRLDQHRKLREALAVHYEPVTREEIPERLAALLRAPGGSVVSLGERRVRGLRWLRQNYTALAATLVAGMFAGQLLPRDDRSPAAMNGGAMIARGEIADALETQLASAQAPDSKVQIGVTFEGQGGQLCRTFEAPEMAGLACRHDGNWQLVVTAPGRPTEPTGSYRQAESGVALVMQGAQNMMAADPLDATAERAARDAGWTGASAKR
jgi:hypothetical protein